jgi:hypothetical protein
MFRKYLHCIVEYYFNLYLWCDITCKYMHILCVKLTLSYILISPMQGLKGYRNWYIFMHIMTLHNSGKVLYCIHLKTVLLYPDEKMDGMVLSCWVCYCHTYL